MTFDYYDTWEFDRINALFKVDPIRATHEFEDYFKKYPKDYSARSFYLYCLITINEIEKAQEELNKIYYEFNHDKDYAQYGAKKNILKYGLVQNNIRIQCLKGNYKLAYELYERNKDLLKGFQINDIMLYCKKKLGKLDGETRDNKGYLHRQILEYKEEDFLDHIKKHLADYNKDLDDPNANVFSSDFPIEDVLKEVKKYIPGNTKTCPGFWENAYYFKYEACGRANNRVVNHFKVICFNNTADMITICPVDYAENFPQVDLSYMIKYNDKIKKTSALDRFNRRYKK